MGALAVLEVLDRDGGVRQGHAATTWPLRVGRALDNDLVLDDANTAAHHFIVDIDDNGGVFVEVVDSVNGLRCGGLHLNNGERRAVGERPLDFIAGRTHFRLRLASHALPAEQALLGTPALGSRLRTLVPLALAVAVSTFLGTYLATEPDSLVRVLGTAAITVLGAILAWCGAWTLLSKIFTRQAHFGWHLRVAMTALLAWEGANLVTGMFAFAFSRPWLTDFSFAFDYVVAGLLLYFHLQAVDTHRPRRTQVFAATTIAVGIVLHLWFNWQNNERLGNELYLSDLFPPVFRVAKPVDTPTFMSRVAPMKARLDDLAKKADEEEDDGGSGEE
jgi:hypothetical protein